MNTYRFDIKQGATFNPVLKYSVPAFTVKTITGVTQSGQAVVTATAHGLPVDWPVWIVGVAGMSQINHLSADLSEPEKSYYAYVVDANTLRLNLDASRFDAYTSGGELLYHAPVNLTGYTARMQIRRSKTASTTVASLTTENSRIALGGTSGTITFSMSATDTALLEPSQYVYDLEVESAGGVVTRLLEGLVVVSGEVTR